MMPGRMTSTQQYDLDLLDQKNHHQPQIAMDGQLHDEDTSLAASTGVHKDLTLTQRADFKGGIHVDYEVKVKLGLEMGSELTCKVPFMLSRPRENLHSVANTFTDAGEPDLTPVVSRPCSFMQLAKINMFAAVIWGALPLRIAHVLHAPHLRAIRFLNACSTPSPKCRTPTSCSKTFYWAGLRSILLILTTRVRRMSWLRLSNSPHK